MTTEQLYQEYLKSDGICTDSRTIRNNQIFFAIKGVSFDGNKFTEQALKNGACLAVIDDYAYSQVGKTMLVKDTLTALQELASLHRKKNNFKIIGVTGTNGKTTTKELITAVLKKKYNVAATTGNFNNHIGVPLTLLSFDSSVDIGIVEMGANHRGEIDLLCRIASPDYGLITNIGKAHIEGFGSIENIIKTKTELYRYLDNKGGTIFYNLAEISLNNLLHNIKKSKVITYGNSNTSCFIEEYIENQMFLTLRLNLNKRTYMVNSNLFGRYNAYNILSAISIGDYFKVNPTDIVQAISDYKTENSRSQIVQAGTNKIILDCYNANPTSMKLVIEELALQVDKQKVLILGEMNELGQSSSENHQQIINLVRELFKDSLILYVGEFFYNFRDTSMTNEFYYKSTDKLARYINNFKLENSLILIKGSRSNKLEEIANKLINTLT